MPVMMALGMGALGLLKSETIDKPAANRKRDLAATTQRLSPWTGMTAQPVPEVDSFGTALQFGASGAQMGMGLEQNALNTKLKEAQLSKMSANAKPVILPNGEVLPDQGQDGSWTDMFNTGDQYNTGVMGTKYKKTPWG